MNKGGGGGYSSGYSHWNAARDLVAAVRNTAPTFYIDLDMLPFGRIGDPGCSSQSPVGPGCGRETRYTHAEQQSIFTLWSIVQAPMIAGADLTTADDWTRSLLTNAALRNMTEDIGTAWEAIRTNTTEAGFIAWQASSKTPSGQQYVAVFNLWNASQAIAVPWVDLGVTLPPATAWDLWAGRGMQIGRDFLSVTLGPHAVVLLAI